MGRYVSQLAIRCTTAIASAHAVGPRSAWVCQQKLALFHIASPNLSLDLSRNVLFVVCPKIQALP